MPRYQKRDRAFQLGNYWLSRRAGSAGWQRTWFDATTRQTRRASLGTADFEQAKERLTDWYVANRALVQEKAQDVLLSDILARYWEGHASNLVSHGTARSSINHWLDFWKDSALGDVRTIAKQEAFQQYLQEKGLKATGISRVLSVGRAAINRAWKRGEIDSPPFIHEVATAQDKKAAPPLGRALEPREISALFEAASYDALRTFIVMLIATGARPIAILELTLERCDVENRLLTLNPQGRVQNKKYRPTLRMPESIVPLLQSLHDRYPPDVHVIGESDSPILSVKRSWNTARKKAGLDDQVRPYSIRHTMARWLRKQGVPAWEVAAQLGHKQQGLGITEIYAPHDPSYLSKSTMAIDSFFAHLRSSCVALDDFLKQPSL